MRQFLALKPLYPLRPLTEAGRVLLCVAASLFAALVLVAWAAAPVEAAADEPAQALLVTSTATSALGGGITSASAAR